MATKQLQTNLKANLKRAREALDKIEKHIQSMLNAKTPDAVQSFQDKADRNLNNLFDGHSNMESNINSLRYELIEEFAKAKEQKVAKDPKKAFMKSADKVANAVAVVKKAEKKLKKVKGKHQKVVETVLKVRKVRSDKGTKVDQTPQAAFEHNPLTLD